MQTFKQRVELISINDLGDSKESNEFHIIF